jgi:hypothetical protein
MLPRVSPFPLSEERDGGFSLDLYLKHREYNAVAGAVAMVAALVVKMMLTKANR